MNYIRVNNDNKDEFKSVLPEYISDGGEISLAAYEDDGTVCGAVSVSYGGNQYDVDWLYVAPERRLKKIGTGLITEIKRLVSAVGVCPIVARIDTSVDSGLYEFFLSISNPDLLVDINYSHDRYLFKAEDFLDSPAMKEKADMPYVPTYFSDMKPRSQSYMMHEAVEFLTITDPMRFEERLEKKLCFAVEENGVILSFMLVQKDAAGDLELSFLYSDNSKALLSIMKAAHREVRKNYKDKFIYFDAVTEESAALAKRFLPETDVRQIYEAEF